MKVSFYKNWTPGLTPGLASSLALPPEVSIRNFDADRFQVMSEWTRYNHAVRMGDASLLGEDFSADEMLNRTAGRLEADGLRRHAILIDHIPWSQLQTDHIADGGVSTVSETMLDYRLFRRKVNVAHQAFRSLQSYVRSTNFALAFKSLEDVPLTSKSVLTMLKALEEDPNNLGLIDFLVRKGEQVDSFRGVLFPLYLASKNDILKAVLCKISDLSQFDPEDLILLATAGHQEANQRILDMIINKDVVWQDYASEIALAAYHRAEFTKIPSYGDGHYWQLDLDFKRFVGGNTPVTKAIIPDFEEDLE